jgi:hypothetical protein
VSDIAGVPLSVFVFVFVFVFVTLFVLVFVSVMGYSLLLAFLFASVFASASDLLLASVPAFVCEQALELPPVLVFVSAFLERNGDE